MEAARNYHLELMGMNFIPLWEEVLEEYIKSNFKERGL
jgi:hypothetical protein